MKNTEKNVEMTNDFRTNLLFARLELKKLLENNHTCESAITLLTDKYVERLGKQEGLIIANHLLNTLLYQGYMTEQEFEELHTELLIIENLNY